jgi:hypothetical protein
MIAPMVCPDALSFGEAIDAATAPLPSLSPSLSCARAAEAGGRCMTGLTWPEATALTDMSHSPLKLLL